MTDETRPAGRSEPSEPDRRLYGRGSGRPLSARQQALIDDMLPRVSPPAGPIDLHALFPEARAVRLEIGFGAGDHLVEQAERAPMTGFLGVEFFLEGVAKALSRLAASDAKNVAVERGDGRDVLDRLPVAGLEMVYLLFPDPWPKTRHHKRRFLQPDTVAALARVIRPGGVCRVATDVRGYVTWTLEQMRAQEAFAWTAQGPEDWRTPPADHVSTRYERKNLGDCPPTFLEFRRR